MKLMAENWPKVWISYIHELLLMEAFAEENMNHVCTRYKYMHKECVLYMYLLVASLSSSA